MVAKLFEKSVFKIVTPNSISSNARIFNLNFVNKIKNPSIDRVYKISWLVVQAYNNKEKDLILTQVPIIQWVSQDFIVYLATIFQNNNNIKLYL